MSERNWTDPQRYSIEARGGSVLVSAAAGSGKTAVLVERVIRRITDEHNPVDVNRLLVVTFTRAAAAEMRQRLSEALAQKIAEHPEDERYQQQQLLLPHAAITTVDGFCAQLLRQYAANAGLPPRFKVAEEGEVALIAARALDEVLEESYTRGDAAFLQLASLLGSNRDDGDLRSAVQQAYTFMQAQTFPEQWLKKQLDAYTKITPIEDMEWVKPLLTELMFTLESCVSQYARMVEMADSCGLVAHADFLRVERKQLENLKNAMNEGDYADRLQRLEENAFGRLPTVKNLDAVQTEIKEYIKNLRDSLKKKIAAATKSLYSVEDIREDVAQLAPLVEALGDLVQRYTVRFTELKRQKKLVDYNDLEHECLRLLLDGETEKPTPLAKQLSLQFDEIMVDEYQDTNAAQDALFRALSRDGNNLFMVGDVKQSIYGFRLAMPGIFTARRDEFEPYDPKTKKLPATITLENNFRSRETVTDTVNFLFRQLMQASVGGVNYDEREALVYSADYEESPGFETEWLLLDKLQASEECPDNEVAEARAIARRIREQMDTLAVRTKNGSRPLEYGDICILMRYRRTMSVYIKELNRLGIPAGAESSGTLLSTPEVRTALALLRTIDNPLREIELTALMMSPLYGFTADDCARVRLIARADKKHEPLFTVIELIAQGARSADEALTARCRRLIADLRRFRTLAVTLPADRLLERLYRDTALPAVFSARAGGRQRVANLHQLDRVARGFEQDGFRGLSAFIRHIDRLEEQGKELAAGNSIGGNSVRLMTIHGSKGLEFPVVYLARMSGQFSTQDARKKLLFHDTAGIGLRRVDEQAQTKGHTLPFDGVLAARRQDERAEELRVWSVAMTRAHEKLCIVLTQSDLRKRLAGLEVALTPARTSSPESILHAANPGD
jgi:ATP-dependent helicase/nuclease subunit A